jgi:hypothetical protein
MRPTLLLLAAAATACSGDTIVVGDLAEVAIIKAIPNRDLDLLFVVDNSSSMLDQQQALAAAFPRMIDALTQLDGALPNLHIGVVTSDLGTSALDGAPPAPPVGIGTGACEQTGDDGVLRTSALLSTNPTFIDTGTPNFGGALAEAFQDLAVVGTEGCGFEQHLGAAARAVTHPANAGFLRPTANLAVVFIADEDDCSAASPSLFAAGTSELGPLDSYRCTREGVRCTESLDEPGDKTGCTARDDSAHVAGIQPFVDALFAVKPDPRMLMTAAIVGDPEPVHVTRTAPLDALALAPSCLGANPDGPENAMPAVRIATFLEAFPGRARQTTICGGDLAAPLDQIGESARRLLGDPCLDTARLVDTSGDPGVQPACEVLDIVDSNPGARVELPPCSAGAARDCYELVADAATCPDSADHIRIAFRRAAPAEDLWATVRCQLAD